MVTLTKIEVLSNFPLTFIILSPSGFPLVQLIKLPFPLVATGNLLITIQLMSHWNTINTF